MKKSLLSLLFLLLVPSFSLNAQTQSAAPKRLWDYKRTHFNIYSLKDDIAIGEKFQKMQIEAFKKKGWGVNPPQQQKLHQRLKDIVARLAKASDLPGLPYEVTLFDKKDVANAYCLPGGKIGVFTGLFDKQKGLVNEKSDDEIAAVLAHEIAHATQRHITRRLTSYNSIGVLGSLVSMGVGKGLGQNWGYLTNQVFNVGANLYFPTYSRKQETESDQVGFYIMAKAGFNPQAAITVWDRAAATVKKQGKADKTQFFDSHPAGGERANFLRGYLNDALSLKK